jgi:ribosomal-protein-alanine N-acetyltransferase
MSLDYARAIVGWQYEAPYDFYNLPAETAEVDITEIFLNPSYHYHAILDSEGALIAYQCFGEDARVPGGDYSADALDLGGGLRPDLTGQGLGPLVIRAAMDFARSAFAPRIFRKTVAAWNIRAIRAAEKAGYRQIASFTSPFNIPFVILVCDAGE